MADDRNQDRERNPRDENAANDRSRQAGQGGRDRTIGEGMNSPDSTQMPLKASTGEPDLETQRKPGSGGAAER